MYKKIILSLCNINMNVSAINQDLRKIPGNFRKFLGNFSENSRKIPDTHPSTPIPPPTPIPIPSPHPSYPVPQPSRTKYPFFSKIQKLFISRFFTHNLHLFDGLYCSYTCKYSTFLNRLESPNEMTTVFCILCLTFL